MKVDRECLSKAFNSSPFEIFSRMMETDSGKIAYKRTGHVLKVSLSIYVPLAIICAVLFAKYNYMALPVWLVVILSAFPFTKYIMIPLSEKKKDDIERSIIGTTRREQIEKVQ